jgi:dTDP-4-amino-4,6-dideoxygalactose transaminase
MTIKLSKSIVGDLEKEALASVIDNSYLGMGKNVNEFETKLRDYLNARHVICINSGTAALHLALMAAGIGQGDEVLVQSLTFVASYQAISATGAIPVPCEILPETVTIDLRDAEKKITKRTKAIMPVHYASRPGDLDSVYNFAKKYNLRVIEDAAHAFGCTYKDKLIGSFGDIICFSFDGIKNITCGEGGAVVTNDDSVANYIKDARLLGVQKDTEKRYAGSRSWDFDVTHQGFRYHMSNLFASIGIVQFGRFEKEFKPKRQFLAGLYNKNLKDLQTIEIFKDDYSSTVPHLYVIKVKNGKRDLLKEYLLENDIETGIHYKPNHLLSFYKSNYSLPVTEQIYSELLSLPMHPDIDEKNIAYIAGRIIKYLGD